MSEKILLVDDDRNILDGYRRSLRSEFAMETVEDGQHALDLLQGTGGYGVVISDMRMPGMDGIELLKRVRKVSPDTVRIMLTGNADVQTAIEAINEGNIFRFLIKPCSRETMAKAITAALVQYRLVVAEKQLLEQTLSGCLQVLSEVLSLVNPAAFSRAERARRYIHQVVTALRLGNPWQYEVAAMLSQLGCVTLAPEIVDTVYRGDPLSATEQEQYDEHPRVASGLISKIPRLEPIAWMIGHQDRPVAKDEVVQDSDMRTGAEILRMILEYEQLTHRGMSRSESVHLLARKNPQFSSSFFETLVMLDPNAEASEIKKRRIEDLAPGMILQQEVRNRLGALVVSRGQEVTSMLIFKLKNSCSRGDISGEVMVSMPKSTLSFVKSASSE